MAGTNPSLPRVKGLPLVGSLPSLLLRQLDLLEDAQRTLGSLFQLDLGVTSLVVAGSPDHAEEVLVRNARDFDKSGDFWDTLREALGDGLPVSTGDLWRRQRRLMSPEFQPRRLDELRKTIAETVVEQLPSLPSDGRPVDVEAWSHGLLATLTIRVLLGSQLALSRVEQLRPAMATMFDYALLGLINRRLPRWMTLRARRRFLEARRVVDDDVMAMIAERRTHQRQEHDLLGLLLQVTDEQGSMDDRQLRDEIVALYIGGYETTGSTLAWMLWLLAERPTLVAQLNEELDAAPDPMHAPLLEACIREGLRLYPPGPLIPRRTAVDTTLGPYSLPAGTHVMVAPWLIHRDPTQWPNPLQFEPSRFLGAEAGHERHRLAWCPFGAGQRLCIGRELAMMELRYSLSTLLRRFVVRTVPSHQPRVKLSTTIQSRSGIMLRFEAR